MSGSYSPPHHRHRHTRRVGAGRRCGTRLTRCAPRVRDRGADGLPCAMPHSPSFPQHCGGAARASPVCIAAMTVGRRDSSIWHTRTHQTRCPRRCVHGALKRGDCERVRPCLAPPLPKRDRAPPPVSWPCKLRRRGSRHAAIRVAS